MSKRTLEEIANREYKAGFVTDIDQESAPPGLDEEIVRFISRKKEEPEWLLEYRLKAYRHWTTLNEPRWAMVSYPEIDYQDHVYYSAPKSAEGPKSLDEVDPELLRTYEKLGIPLAEQEKLAGVAVDAVFDSVSVATTFKEKLAEKGIIFCSFCALSARAARMLSSRLIVLLPSGLLRPRPKGAFSKKPRKRIPVARARWPLSLCKNWSRAAIRWSSFGFAVFGSAFLR